MLLEKSEIPQFDLMFPEFKLGKHILILGSTGSGKTNFLIWLISELLKRNYRLVIFNPIGHLELEKLSNIVLDEKDIFNDKLEHFLNDYTINSICITPNESFISDFKGMRILTDRICKIIYFHEDIVYSKMMEKKGKVKDVDFRRRSNLIFINDELMFNDDRENLSKFYHAILHRGQNLGISHVGNTQRNQYISKLITTQSIYKIIFQLDKYDITALKDKIKNIELVEFLPDYHFISTYKDRKIKFFKPLPLLKE